MVAWKHELDALRLVALRRIPRCAGCPRFAALGYACAGRGVREYLPPVPDFCKYAVCGPLAARYGKLGGSDQFAEGNPAQRDGSGAGPAVAHHQA